MKEPAWIVRTMWRDVAELGAMLRAYTSPEQPAPAPTWPREASANVELEVARDAIEQHDVQRDGEIDRLALFDSFVDVAYSYFEYKRYATRAMRGLFTIEQLDEVLHRWINRRPESIFRPTALTTDGDFAIGPGGDLVPRYSYDAPLVDSGRVRTSWKTQATNPIDDIEKMRDSVLECSARSGYAVGDRLRAPDGTEYYVTAGKLDHAALHAAELAELQAKARG